MPKSYDKNLNQDDALEARILLVRVRIGGRPRVVAEPFSRRVAYLPSGKRYPPNSCVVWCVPPNFVYKYSACYQTYGDMVVSLVGAAAESHREGTIRQLEPKTGGAALIRSPPNRTCANGDNLPASGTSTWDQTSSSRDGA